ncbi:glycosyltransferase family 2 protein [Flavobacterium sp. N502540]|uniref:glycosyltransferase family 2 protein n=1 Tax=Flavobacterium sp. N502540 TaxID=2986838 RepID=UPI0022257A92|nr:galactosyltransferase-related protein [Flavobacterium sp. N502540]
MITLVLTNRNRDLRIVKKCLDSLQQQNTARFTCFLVDYGSDLDYLPELKVLLLQFPKITFISCPVSGQLWNKSRAINIALQQATSEYFLVGDIDLIFSPNFIQKCYDLMTVDEVHYFQYGFLSQKESLLDKEFKDYKVDFAGSDEVTGTTIFPTSALKKLNGYDEFYHGWGAEDTDIHIRMKNAGLKVTFYDQKILIKHQWHPKAYRSKQSQHPFQSQLERINQFYMHQTLQSKRTVINDKLGFGKETVFSEYEKLDQKADSDLRLNNSQIILEALFAQMDNFSGETVQITIEKVSFSVLLKSRIKQLLGRKYLSYIPMENINNTILLQIIKTYRNNPYRYTFDRQKNIITLIIRF